jgi:hypothetical protein
MATANEIRVLIAQTTTGTHRRHLPRGFMPRAVVRREPPGRRSPARRPWRRGSSGHGARSRSPLHHPRC